jgi:cryptochrome
LSFLQAKFPSKYIYEPWTAPLSVQQEAGCIIGRDYPAPIVDHDIVSKENMSRMKEAYANQPGGGAADDDDDDEPATARGGSGGGAGSRGAKGASASSSSSSGAAAGKKRPASGNEKDAGAMDKFVKKKK